jgi:predicted aldo/keto reductase-like oxidoreductase
MKWDDMGMKSARFPSRREFLKAGAAGVAGTSIHSSCSRPGAQDRASGKRNIVYRTLGRTGIRLPVVSLGAVAIELVRTALDEGMAYIHTSSSYSERNQERRLGEVCRTLARESFMIGTSPDLPYLYMRGRDLSADIGTAVNPSLITKSMEDSLRLLGLEYVDIYYLASVNSRSTALHEPYLAAFAKLKKEGKTRFIGITTHSNEPEVIRAAAESGIWDVALTAYNFRQSYSAEIRSAIARAAGAGMGIVAMKTQAGVYWGGPLRRKINMKAALKWVLQDENVHTTIPAVSNYDEMTEDLSVMDDLTLTPAELRDLKLGEELGLSGMYCQQCRRCLAQCAAGLDVPALMRASMYAFGYQRAGKARDMLQAWKPSTVACTGCRDCSVRCTLGLDIRSKAVEVARLLEQ